MTSAIRDDAALRASLRHALDQAGTPRTVKQLAETAGLTNGGALAYLRELTATGHAVALPDAGRPAPYLTRYATPVANSANTLSTAATTTGGTDMPAPAPEPRPQEQSQPPVLAAALAYAARGWHVFPLRPGDKRPAFPDHAADTCTGRDRRCAGAARHVTWEERATTDPARIERAWGRPGPDGRDYGIGIACGPSCLVVIDLDIPKPGHTAPEAWQLPGVHDGGDVLAVLADRAGQPYPAGGTYTVTTPSGGTHLYYVAPDAREPATGVMRPGISLRNTTGDLGWLIDTRAHGGYVAAPPTTTPTGAYQATHDAPVADLPHWLCTALTPRSMPPQKLTHAPLRPDSGPAGASDRRRRDAYLTQAVARQCAAVLSAGEGARNRALYLSAVALGQLVAGGELNADSVRGQLETAATTAGLTPTETARTISSGLRAGANRPRTLATAPADSTDRRAA